MKKILIFSFFLSLTLLSCMDNDDISGNLEVFDKPVIKNDGSQVDEKIVSVYEKYNTYFKYEFEDQEYRWNWTGNELRYYSAADINKVEEVIDTVVNGVYKVFPEEFAKEYLAYKVLLVDSLYTGGRWSDDLDYETGVNFIIIGNVGDRFDDKDKKKLKEELLSLFVEELFSKIPYPTDFASISAEYYSKYWVSSLSAYAFLRKDWSSGRKPPKVAQDFGDFVSMIVYKTQEEKEALFAQNIKIKHKMNLVIEYFKDNFGITFPTVD